MEYQKNLLNETNNNYSKFKTRTCFEVNDESCSNYSTDSQIMFVTSFLRSNLCDHCNAYIFVKKKLLQLLD